MALDLILTGRPVAADEALRIGLASRVVPAGEAREQAVALGQQIASVPTGMRARTAWPNARAGPSTRAPGRPTAVVAEHRAGRGQHCPLAAGGGPRGGVARFDRGSGRHGKPPRPSSLRRTSHLPVGAA